MLVDPEPRPLDTFFDPAPKGEEPPPKPGTWGTVWNSFQLDNQIISGAVSEAGGYIGTERDPNFRPFALMKDTPYEGQDSLLEARNEKHFYAIKRDIDREDAIRRDLHATKGTDTFVAGLFANMLDPSILIPGGAFYRGTKGGFSVLKSSLSTGSAAMLGVTQQELMLHYQQQTRDPLESVFNIGVGGLIGSAIGVAGSGIGNIFNAREWRHATAAVERGLGLGTIDREVYDDVLGRLTTAGMDAGEAKINAGVWAARYQVLAQDFGGDATAMDLYRSVGFDVRGPGGEAVAGRTLDQLNPVAEWNLFENRLEQARKLRELQEAKEDGTPLEKNWAGYFDAEGNRIEPPRSFDQSARPPGPENPGAGVEPGNMHGFEPDLRVSVPDTTAMPPKPLFVQKTTNNNAQGQIDNVDLVLAAHPDADSSPAAWSRMMAHALASNEVPIPPYAFLRDINGDGAVNTLRRLTDGQIADANHGFETAAKFRAAYVKKELPVTTTGKLFLWSFLSRGVSPYVQEGLFIDAFKGVEPWIKRAVEGKFTEADLPAYEAWVRTVAPKGAGQPGAGATHNLNAFGKNFLLKMGARDADGVSHLQRMHNLLEHPEMTGQQIRREFAKISQGVGIDNKVMSFTLLVAGHSDVMVLDRVQIRALWDDGRFGSRNLYDGRKNAEGKAIEGTALSDLTYGARGLLVYEALERALGKRLGDIYGTLGRPNDASVGRFHWETWVAQSQQEASHGTIRAILEDAKGVDSAIAQVTAKQGEYGAYEYGARYYRDDQGPGFHYTTPDGNEYNFTVPAFRAFLAEIKNPKTGVVPDGFKVQGAIDEVTGKAARSTPWFEDPAVNQAKLDERAVYWADRGGGTGEGGRVVRESLQREMASDLGGQGFRAEELGALRQFFQSGTQAPAFYSAVERAITTSKTAKASPDQWLATLRNTQGIKAEEMEWLGLEDWLKQQKGAVTREQIADYVRANQIEVKEVTRGGGASEADRARYNELLRRNNLSAREMDDLDRLAEIVEGAEDSPPGTKFGSYTLPGGENYRELLLTLPVEPSKFDPSQVEIKRRMPSATQGTTAIWYQGKKIIEYDDPPALQPGGGYDQKPKSYWMEVAQQLYDKGDRINKVPSRSESFTSSHWDEPNVLAHVRFNDRVIDGKRTLFLEEVQSDWHQKGKREGYQSNSGEGFTLEGNGPWVIRQGERFIQDFNNRQAAQAQLEAYQRGAIVPDTPGVPDAPFKTSWPELALKRMIRYAAENGYEKIAWTPGRVQADRYDLSKQIDSINYNPNNGMLFAYKNGDQVINKNVAPEDLPDTIGKEAADRLLNNPTKKETIEGPFGIARTEHTLSGIDLSVGGEGMIGFYDKMLPAAANKLGKKYGAKVGREEMGASAESKAAVEAEREAAWNDLWPRLRAEDYLGFETAREAGVAIRTHADFAERWDMGLAQEAAQRYHDAYQADKTASKLPATSVHTLEVTPALRKAATEEGFPLFQGGKPTDAGLANMDARGRITLAENKAIIDLFEKADKSTFMHESSHLWLDELIRFGSRADAPQKLKDDLAITLRWLGVERAEDIKVVHHEKWARGFEQYLATGEAPSSFLAKAFERFKEWLTTIYKSLDELGAPISDEIKGVFDRMLATDADLMLRNQQMNGHAQSVGAAALSAPPIESLTIAGKAAGAVAKATEFLVPGLRIIQSPVAEVRNFGANLFEMSTYMKGNEDGLASPRAAETLRKEWNAGMVTAIEDTNQAFKDYRKAGGTQDRTWFHEEVGRSMRRGDQNAVPEVAKVAQAWRKNVADPLKDAAIEAGLLAKDVSVDTAVSYFSRMWNKEKLLAEKGAYFNIVVPWVKQNLPAWAQAFDKGVERRLDPLRREISDLEFEKLRRESERKVREGEIEAGEVSEADIRNAIRIVKGGAPKPKDVQTLTGFIHAQGGMVEDAGELAAMGVNNKSRPGFVRSQRRTKMDKRGGWDVDSMAVHAHENGYFDHVPDRREFLEALADDFNKHRVIVPRGQEDAFRLVDLVNRLEDDLARLGVQTGEAPRFSTSEEVKGVVDRVFKALDAEADHKIGKLKEKLKERQNAAADERDQRFLGDPDELGRLIAQETWETLTGRTAEGMRPTFVTVNARGPLKERTFNIPDELVEEFLVDDVMQVMQRYQRIMSADVELANADARMGGLGKPDMLGSLAKVREGYDKLRDTMPDGPEKRALGKREDADMRDLRALRDLIRGQYEKGGEHTNFGRIAREAAAVQYMMKMGQVVVSSLTEPFRVAAAKGFINILGDSVSALGNIQAAKLSVREAKLAGNIIDKATAARLWSIADLGNFYGSRTPMEKFLDNMTNIASTWNGIRMWTDGVKSIASTRIQNEILDLTSRYGKAGAEGQRYLNFLGLDESASTRIADLFKQHGETIGGIRVAHTERWVEGKTGAEYASARQAQRDYRAALNKDLDSMVVTRGVADVPLFANSPLGKLLFQFSTFNIASHQRILLRGLQESQVRFLSGVLAMSTMGMVQTYLHALMTNSVDKLPNMKENPGWWIAEGLDRSGIFSVPFQLSNAFEKLAGTNPIKAPIKLKDEGQTLSQKNRNRNLGSMVGPSAGTIEDIGRTLYEVNRGLQMGPGGVDVNREPVSKANKNAMERLLPFNSYLGVRWLLKYFFNPPHE